MMNVELEKKYFSLITSLKILSGRVNDEKEAKRYRALAEQLQKIREKRHLDLIGEDGENKKRYKQMLEFVDSNYDEGNEIDSAKSLCNILMPEVKEYGER